MYLALRAAAVESTAMARSSDWKTLVILIIGLYYYDCKWIVLWLRQSGSGNQAKGQANAVQVGGQVWSFEPS